MIEKGPALNFNAILGTRPYSISGRVGVNGVIGQIKRLLDQLPEVQQASGAINIKLEGQKARTVTFKYK